MTLQFRNNKGNEESLMKNISKLFFTITLVASLSACKGNNVMPTPDVVKFNSSSLYPEGVGWDATNKRFLVTSIRKGEVGSVKDDGSYWVFAKDSRMVSSVGIRIDEMRDRVLVCNADPGAAEKSSPATTGKLAGLAVFQLSTGKLIKYIDLAKGIDGGIFVMILQSIKMVQHILQIVFRQSSTKLMLTTIIQC